MKTTELTHKIETINMFKHKAEFVRRAIFVLDNKDDISIDSSVKDLLYLPVSKISVFKDQIWDFNMDVVNPAANVKGAKLRIDFSKYDSIPNFIIIELKCLFLSVYLLPKSFIKSTRKGKGKGKSSLKPNTIISQFEAGLRYLNHAFKSLTDDYTEKYVQESYQSLADIHYGELKQGMDTFGGSKDSTLKSFFNYLSNPSFKEFLGFEVDYHEQILGKVKSKSKNGLKGQEINKKFFTNEEFIDVVTYSSNRIMQFLLWQGKEHEISDKASLTFFQKHYCKDFEGDFKVTPQILNEYRAIRLIAKGYDLSYIESICQIPSYFFIDSRRLHRLDIIRKLFKEHYKIEKLDSLRLQINEIYYASCFLICIYMGGRPEEISNIHLEHSFSEKEGVPVILSNVGKNEFENLRLFDDAWVRTPIMNDAFRVAKMISGIYQNDYLLGNVDTFPPGKKQKEMTSTGMTNFFSKYLAICLHSKTNLTKQQKIKEIGFNPYFFRHTLAYQLHRMGTGLPLISFQLKHMVEGVERFSRNGAASVTTIEYGAIAESLVENKMQSDFYYNQAEREKVLSFYNPNGTYVGKQGKEHKVRIQKFFAGYMAAGYTEDEVIDQLIDQGVAVIDVGTGFCGGGQEDFDESLPCIGTLRCNPKRCKHAIISQVHIPKWKELYILNKSRLTKEKDPEVKQQLIAVINEAKMVLDEMGVEV